MSAHQQWQPPWVGVVDAMLEPSRVARDLRELTKAHRTSLAEYRKELRRHKRAQRFKRGAAATAPIGPRIPAPPQRLRAGAPGAHEVGRLIVAQRQMMTVLAQVEALAPAAAAELCRATATAAPALAAQVDRLASLDDVIRRLRTGEGAAAARESASAITHRLRGGVAAYERLVHAAITMLAAPDPAHDVVEQVTPAVLGLESYAHGLHQSARALER